MPIIQFKNVYLSYDEGVNVLDNVSFNIEKGDKIALIGENGSGKSTIGKLILSLLKPNKGEIFIFDKNINNLSKNDKQKIGMVFQNPDNQFIGNTVADDVAFGLENRNIPSKEMDKIIDEKLKEVDMLEYKNYQPSYLSGGQKQRVAIASNIALDLSIIVFDEATSMLDPKGILEVNKIISRIKENNKDLTIILITHNMEEVLSCNKVFALKNHKLAYIGTPDLLFKNKTMCEKINIVPPFKYSLVHKLKDIGVDVSFSDSLDIVKEKIIRWESK